MVQLAGQGMLVDRTATHSEDVVLDAVTIGIALKGMEMPGDDRISSVLYQQRMHPAIPFDPFVPPEGAMHEQNDWAFALAGACENTFKPRQLFFRQLYVSIVERFITKEHNNRGLVNLHGIVHGAETSSVSLDERVVLRITSS